MKLFSLGILVLFLVGCTDAWRMQFETLGNQGHIVCYSGGTVIYAGDFTGKIATEKGSDGWYFEEKGTGQLIRLSGDCIIRN